MTFDTFSYVLLLFIFWNFFNIYDLLLRHSVKNEGFELTKSPDEQQQQQQPNELQQHQLQYSLHQHSVHQQVKVFYYL